MKNLLALLAIVSLPVIAETQIEKTFKLLSSKKQASSVAQENWANKKKSLKEVEQQKAQATSDKSTIDGQIQTIDKQVTKTNNQIEKFKKSIISLETVKIVELEKQISSRSCDLEEKENRVEQLRQHCVEMQKNLEKLKADNGSGDHDEEIMVDREYISAYQNRLEMLTGEIAVVDPDYARFTKELGDAKTNLENLKNKIDVKNEQITKWVAEKADLNTKLAAAGKALSSATANYDKFTKELENLKNVRDQKAKEVQATQQDYNKQRSAFIADYKNRGKTDGKSQAENKAEELAKIAAEKEVNRVVPGVASNDKNTRDFAKGYNDAAANLKASDLETAYNKFFNDGKKLAEDNVRQKYVVEGYNNALANLWDQKLDKTVTEFSKLENESVKITNPRELYFSQKVRAPKVRSYKVPTLESPIARNVIYTKFDDTEALLKHDCVKYVIAQLKSECISNYSSQFYSAYNKSFNPHYATIFNAHFKNLAGSKYDELIKSKSEDSYQQGRLEAAKVYGKANGFNSATDAIKDDALAEGAQNFENDLKKSAVLYYRSIRIEDENGDNMYSPGEGIYAVVEIDNYGYKPADGYSFGFALDADGDIQTNSRFFKTFSPKPLEPRAKSIIKLGPIATAKEVLTNKKFTLSLTTQGRMDKGTDKTFTFENKIVRPLEVTKVSTKQEVFDLYRNKQTVIFHIANNTGKVVPVTPIKLTTKDPVMKFYNNGNMQYPSTDKNMNIATWAIPNDMISEDIPVQFNLQFSYEGKVYNQKISKSFKINREMSIELTGNYGDKMYSREVNTYPGGNVRIGVRFKFKDNDNPTRGSYSFRYVGSNLRGVHVASGTTVGWDLGQADPKRERNKTRTFNIMVDRDQKLSGKRTPVKFQLTRNGSPVHTATVFLNIN